MKMLFAATLKKLVLAGIVCVFFFQIAFSNVVEAKEEQYPTKPIQFMVGLVAGSLVDLNARALAKVAAKHLEKPVVVVNMPGAGSTTAMNELAKAPPDGHTIVINTSAYESLIVHSQKIPFDRKLIKPLIGITRYGGVLLVRGDFPHAKFDDFVAYGRKNPGKINYGHPGRGSELHIMGMQFFKSAGITAADVPYRGSGETQQALLGGHITSRMGQIAGGTMEYIRAGKLKVVVTFTDKRVDELPDVPTSQEKGCADLSAFIPQIGIYIHRDTPPDRFRKLHDALKKTVEDPEFAKLLGEGLKPVYMSPENYAKYVSKVEGEAIPLLKELKLFIE